jgi:ACT domain-containing protein
MTTININTKSQLAKLIATENITVEHNAVRTASFDTLNRILTLPIFKEKSGDVYDMLIAHECAHALYTPGNGWKEIMNDDELRSYCNVLEDTRIDKLIQKKYPGVKRNYLNGWDILNKQNFFGIKGKDLNTELMLIDKINLRSKSSNRLKFKLSKEEDKWLDVVDSIKSWKDVVKVAKQMLDWQKKRLESLKKLSNFDDMFKDYLQGNEENDSTGDKKESQEAGNSSGNDDNNKEDKQDQESNVAVTGLQEVQGGAGKLKAITDVIYEQSKGKLLDQTTKYNYISLPEANLKDIVISSKEFRKKFKEFIIQRVNNSKPELNYYEWLKTDFKKFKNDNKKTVMYLVKEFEMKKAATAYKRSTTDKTGTIDPLRLKNYKFSDDIFKRLTILPDSKNHGMMMLLDWSGSMCDVLKQTVEQLINLVYFCQKINIPYEVYFFSNEKFDRFGTPKDEENNSKIKQFNYKHGDIALDKFNLVNIASHKMKKTELDESMMYLYSMGLYYGERYSRGSSYNTVLTEERKYNFGMPDDYNLGSTPLNEALIACNQLVPVFKNKYGIEKMTFITLTDGGANNTKGQWDNADDGMRVASIDRGQLVIKHKKKYFSQKQFSNNWWSSEAVTSNLLDIMKKCHGVNTVGFYIIKKIRGHNSDLFSAKDKTTEKRKKEWSKDKVTTAKKPGYGQYFVLNGKTMEVENSNQGLDSITGDLKAGKIKQIFSKSMKGRITSRVLLNKFIEQVA